MEKSGDNKFYFPQYIVRACLLKNFSIKAKLALLFHYHSGKLGVYMVPLMYYGSVPEAVDLSIFNDPKHIDRVTGDIAERTMYYALEKYYKEKKSQFYE